MHIVLSIFGVIAPFLLLANLIAATLALYEWRAEAFWYFIALLISTWAALVVLGEALSEFDPEGRGASKDTVLFYVSIFTALQLVWIATVGRLWEDHRSHER